MKICFKNVEFSYSSEKILDDICLDLEHSKLICILGPNGVGKSTLLHCMNRIISPQKGVILLNGKEVAHMNINEIARHIGFVPQERDDIPALTVMDVVLLGRHPHSKLSSAKNDLDIVSNILRFMDLEDIALRYIDELSGGQRQKVFIARGLAQMPEVLLLDEPTSNLDIRHQLEVMEMLRGLVDYGKLQIIMVSHDLNMSMRYADQVIVMKDGKIFTAGDPRNVITRDVIQSVYGVHSLIMHSDINPYIVPLSSTKEGLSRNLNELGKILTGACSSGT
jgi:iron complex transport system ATP-binding protein